jgi:hypothetical protein
MQHPFRSVQEAGELESRDAIASERALTETNGIQLALSDPPAYRQAVDV